MPEKTARDKAIEKIHSLRKLVEHPNTGDGERAAAQAAIERLQAKHDIKPAQERKEPPRSTGPRNPNFRPGQQRGQYRHTDWFQQQHEEAEAKRRANYERNMANARRRAEERVREQRAAEDAKRRAEAQKRYQERMANRDRFGRPLTAEEQEWARRDPLGFAAAQDKRSHQEKVRDMNEAWGRTNDAMRDFIRTQQGPRKAQEHPKAKPPPLKRCERPETFFDAGGNPRKRNEHQIQCDRCSVMLKPGEGMVFRVGDRWFGRCCEAKPGPRRKRW